MDSGALKTSRNPHSGKRRRRRSGEEEEELEAHQVWEDSVPLPIKEVLEVCLVNRRVRWLEGLDSSNKPEVASWVDSGSRNNKPGVCRRERVRFVNFAYMFDFQFSIRFCVLLLLLSLSLSFASNHTGFSLFGDQRFASSFDRSLLTHDSFFPDDYNK